MFSHEVTHEQSSPHVSKMSGAHSIIVFHSLVLTPRNSAEADSLAFRLRKLFLKYAHLDSESLKLSSNGPVRTQIYENFV